MNNDQFIKSIVEEVLLKLEERMKIAVVVFTGGALGFYESITQLKKLQEEGWELRVLLSISAEYALKPEMIKEELHLDNIYLERTNDGLRNIYFGSQMIIVPTLTLNTAVKLSLGVADTPISNLLSYGIISGTPMIACRDACDLQHPLRNDIQLEKVPPAYLNRMAQHLCNLESYGIHLIDSPQIYEEVKKRTFSLKKDVEPPLKQRVQFRKRILTRGDVIEACDNRSVLVLNQQTIITPLAKETARDFAVEIIID
ncbi:flavoprotein [Salipaludibacillus daqingensis]|uniref:flavoprotein n=1 Tax=Salipaludibacillus daqingensis TaxID=3041001 RepID=UPI002476FC8C|nr:flavoprotein [Salipaludibacillus daqingensis]